MADRSRLNRRLVRQSEKNLFISIAGIIVVLFLLVMYGIPFLANSGGFFAGNKNTTETAKKDKEFIPPPMLDSTFSATNSAQVTITGNYVNTDYAIKLFVNGDIVDTTSVKDDRTFVFEKVPLSEGNNIVEAKAVTKEKKESEASDPLTITYRHKEPTLSIDSPSDGQKYGKDETKAHVAGKTDPGVKVTINEFWAIVDSEGKFSYELPLKGGDQEVKIVATDDAGNSKSETRKITHDQ